MKKRLLNYQINASSEKLQEIFSDLTKFGAWHPLIITATLLDDSSNTYKILEKPYSFLPFKIIYFAEVLSEERKVFYKISGIPLSNAKFTYEFKEITPEATAINCLIEIEGVYFLDSILINKMVDAQNKLMKALSNSLK